MAAVTKVPFASTLSHRAEHSSEHFVRKVEGSEEVFMTRPSFLKGFLCLLLCVRVAATFGEQSITDLHLVL